MKKIVFVRSSVVDSEPRLEREALTLLNHGYEVSIFGWNRTGNSSNDKEIKDYVIKNFPVNAPMGLKIIVYWPLWWIWVFIQLMQSDCEYIQAVDFDSYLPSLIASKIKRCPITYEIYDFYPDLIKLPPLIHKLFTWFDLKIMDFADRIIIVDKCRLNQIHKTEGDNVSIIYNTPTPIFTEKTETLSNIFHVFYGGAITPVRDIKSMLYLSSEIDDIMVEIAGNGFQEITDDINTYCSTHENCQYLGRISYQEIISKSMEADILYALYDPAIPNNRLASPNKLFEAMMCGKPIIVNEGVATADKVREENCGLIVPYGDYEALKEAVLTLKNNPELRKELGENGRRAYETKYNWKIMEKRLLDLYASLEKEQ